MQLKEQSSSMKSASPVRVVKTKVKSKTPRMIVNLRSDTVQPATVVPQAIQVKLGQEAVRSARGRATAVPVRYTK